MKKIRPYFGWRSIERTLHEVIFQVNDPSKKCARGFSYGRYTFVLCTQCLSKRQKGITWNRTARANMAYEKHYSTRPPDVEYHRRRNIHKSEDLECMDCGFKIKGR